MARPIRIEQAGGWGQHKWGQSLLMATSVAFCFLSIYFQRSVGSAVNLTRDWECSTRLAYAADEPSTIMTLRWIAQRLKMESWTHVSNLLARPKPGRSQPRRIMKISLLSVKVVSQRVSPHF